MMKLATEIANAQEIIKRIHTEAEYNRHINQFKSKSCDDPEVLTYMADDKLLMPHERICAVAAMGA